MWSRLYFWTYSKTTPTSNNPHNESNLWAICKEFGVGLKFETTPETYSKLLPINMVSIILNLISVILFSYMNTKIRPYFWSQFLAFVRHTVTAPSFSVRKFVWLCTHHLTIYLTILHSFLSVSSRRCGACAAPSAEHARPQASAIIRILYHYSLLILELDYCYSSLSVWII